MKRVAWLLSALVATACVISTGPKPAVTPAPRPATYSLTVHVFDGPVDQDNKVIDAAVTLGDQVVLTDGAGNGAFAGLPAGDYQVCAAAPQFTQACAPVTIPAAADVNISLGRALPPVPSRAEVLAAHESFQGAVLHTSQFGDLYWWPTAWVSLNDADRAAAYAQVAAWGDTDITVAWKWDYGEAGQPYGTGQRVPPRDFTADPAAFRALVQDVLRHQAANGRAFVPRIFLSGDDGFDAYMARLPAVLAALRPQPDDDVDLTPYAKLQVCYDSCVPGWAGAADDKTRIATALVATRAACPSCVLALEFGAGYASQGDGGDFWQTDAGRAIDEVDWEGNSWPPDNFEQYWEILDRWLGPAYVKPAAQQSDPDAPFGASSAKWFLRKGTPRGPFAVHCFEPYTYDWVRGRVPPSAVPAAFAYLRGLGCPYIDTPQP